ncbi:hypothetical protein EDB81DRAFT_906160 [Dactylonectria macrodidyma]|uniref:BRCT domain-containing protein n=1 Tax=Dactylonectria macrodidyma TaxID=307937 RepID=A0A9P9IQB0_9HYPO|nr:hypothetical protein EDB81DRAFT_906160 [Dactylonectria macrodidyma]
MENTFFYFSGSFKGHTKSKVMEFFQKAKAKTTEDFENEMTVLVVTEAEFNKNGTGGKAVVVAKEKDLPILGESWVYEMMDEKKAWVQPKEEYFISKGSGGGSGGTGGGSGGTGDGSGGTGGGSGGTGGGSGGTGGGSGGTGGGSGGTGTGGGSGGTGGGSSGTGDGSGGTGGGSGGTGGGSGGTGDGSGGTGGGSGGTGGGSGGTGGGSGGTGGGSSGTGDGSGGTGGGSGGTGGGSGGTGGGSGGTGGGSGDPAQTDEDAKKIKAQMDCVHDAFATAEWYMNACIDRSQGVVVIDLTDEVKTVTEGYELVKQSVEACKEAAASGDVERATSEAAAAVKGQQEAARSYGSLAARLDFYKSQSPEPPTVATKGGEFATLLVTMESNTVATEHIYFLLSRTHWKVRAGMKGMEQTYVPKIPILGSKRMIN